MEALAALLGIGLAAAAPFVPGLRPVAKAVVKGGLAVAGATASATATIVEEVSDLAAHLRSGHGDQPEAAVSAAAAAETAAAEASQQAEARPADAAAVGEEPGAGGLSAPSLRPVSKAAVKGGLALADAAKVAAGAAAGVAAVAGKQVGALAASARSEKPALDAAAEEAAADSGATGPMVETAQPADAPGAVDDLTLVAGVGPKTAAMLQAAGVTSFAQLAATPVQQLRAILDQGGPPYRVTDPSSWPAKAQAILDAPPAAPKPFDDADLVQIDGIGPKIADLLRNAGIGSVSQLAVAPVDQLRDILVQAGARFRITDPSSWPAQAQALLAAHKA